MEGKLAETNANPAQTPAAVPVVAPAAAVSVQPKPENTFLKTASRLLTTTFYLIDGFCILSSSGYYSGFSLRISALSLSC